MLTEWLRTIADRHRPGIGIKPWVKYIDQSFDNRTQHTFRVTLRGFGWEMSGDIEAIKVMFAVVSQFEFDMLERSSSIGA
ncbi:MAG: hypothetical protein RB191_04640 [Terriglobia bacterium]|nr:hypothetical protein [Terriglobia bacterium]